MRAAAATALALALALLGAFGVGVAAADFGIASATLELKGGTGSALQAGGHPDFWLDTSIELTDGPNGKVVSGQLETLEVDLPPGLTVDPHAAPACSMAQLAGSAFCDPDSQVGVARVDLAEPQPEGPVPIPIYNMAPPEDEAVVLGASFFGVLQRFRVSLRPEDGYASRVTASPINSGLALARIGAELWGVPQAAAHDADRCLSVLDPCAPLTDPPRPFLTLPGRCEPLTVQLRARSWQEPEAWDSRVLATAPLTGCDALAFAPQVRVRPTTGLADSPSGLDLELRLPQSEDPEGTASAQPRDATVVLPEGLVLNPSFAAGLGVCTAAQIGLISAAPQGGGRFDDAPARCPADSRIGTAAVTTPLLDAPMRGSVYLAEPYRNPHGSLLAAYLDLAAAGIEVKASTALRPDPVTGRLTISLDDLPQLSFSGLELSLAGGAAAPLRTPPVCSAFDASAALTPWSAAPGAPSVVAADRFEISRSPAPGTCPSTPAALPSGFAFRAGSGAARAGAPTSFAVELRRDDGTAQLSGLSFAPPAGVAARIGEVASCADADLAAAALRGGREERAEPSCPASSQVGRVDLAAGAGPAPFRLSGPTYLAGPYEGAPLSLATIVPAVAGPFDLGVAVVRIGLRIDPASARIEASSGPIPALLKGIPLDLRAFTLRLDRPGFIVNPTSCDPMAVEATALTPTGAATALAGRFQVSGCSDLTFAPKVHLRLAGPAHRSAHPSLRATLRMPTRGANLARMGLTLPPALLLDPRRAAVPCTQPAFAAGACPAASRVGYARAWSPLLRRALAGPVYMRASRGRLPDVVAALDGRFQLDLVGSVDSAGGRIRATFATLPDVPISKFRLVTFGGRRGLLVNGTRLCAAGLRAGASFVAHDAERRVARPLVDTGCDPVDAETRKTHCRADVDCAAGWGGTRGGRTGDGRARG